MCKRKQQNKKLLAEIDDKRRLPLCTGDRVTVVCVGQCSATSYKVAIKSISIIRIDSTTLASQKRHRSTPFCGGGEREVIKVNRLIQSE